MKRNYYLYLDESGDFDNDLRSDWKNECLVGGFLVEEDKNIRNEEAKKILANAYRAASPTEIKISDNDAFHKVQHATELNLDKAKILAESLGQAAQKSDFIIFENYNKARIGSSSQTYLTIMIDGIIQLLTRLAMENTGTTVSLHVLAGYRKNTSIERIVHSDKGYISKDEYIQRINERLLLEKIKKRNLLGNTIVEFACDFDKGNPCLVLCDHICNFYFTRSASAFQAEYQDGMTYKERLLSFYKSINIFHLNGSVEQERLSYYIESGGYDTALFDICTDRIEEESFASTLINGINRLPVKQILNILSGLSSYFNNLVDVQREIKNSLKYLKKAEIIIKNLMDSGIPAERYYLDIKLYELAVHNHRGDLKEMGLLFEECRQILNKLLSYAENIDYAFMFHNRHAVYLYDIFEFEKGNELLEKLISSFEAYELVLSELPEQDLSKDGFHATQLGKILGTQVQYCRHQVKLGKMKYIDAAAISDRAINNLPLERDRERQYQYRAQLEAEAGNFTDALKYFNMGQGIEEWGEIFQAENVNPFAPYHLSFLMERFSKGDFPRGDLIRMVRKCKDNEAKIFCQIEFPAFLTCANLAKTMIRLDMEKDVIKKYYRQALKTDEKNTSPLFQFFQLMIHADYISWLLKNKMDAEKEIQSMKEKLAQIRNSGFPESIEILCSELDQILETRDPEKYALYSEQLQY